MRHICREKERKRLQSAWNTWKTHKISLLYDFSSLPAVSWCGGVDVCVSTHSLTIKNNSIQTDSMAWEHRIKWNMLHNGILFAEEWKRAQSICMNGWKWERESETGSAPSLRVKDILPSVFSVKVTCFFCVCLCALLWLPLLLLLSIQQHEQQISEMGFSILVFDDMACRHARTNACSLLSLCTLFILCLNVKI